MKNLHKWVTVCCMMTVVLLVTNVQASRKIGPHLNAALAASQGNEQIMAWVFFTDKGSYESMRTSVPWNVVSERSIRRRLKVRAENEAVDYTDLPVEPQYVSQLAQHVIKVRQRSKWFNAASMMATKQQIEQIESLPFVREIELVYRARFNRELEQEGPVSLETLNGTEGGDQTNDLNYGNSLNQNQQINVVAVHNTGNYAQGVLVGVFDNGFRLLTHQAFDTLRPRIIATYDWVDHKVSVVPNNTSTGFGSHGVNTLSTIGGYRDGQLIGPAWGATFILARTENDSSETPIEEDNWVAAIEWADSIGVEVTSTSLGYLGYDAPYTSWTWQDMNGRTTVITRAAAMAVRRGIIVCNSAGNSAYNASHNTLGAPADGDSVMAIGAVTSTGTITSFSSCGPTTAVPPRIKPDVCAQGSSVRVASATTVSGYTTASGTSFSCPLAAGVAALIVKARPNATNIQIINAMRMTASRANTPDNQYGWGILDAEAAINYLAQGLVVPTSSGWNIVGLPNGALNRFYGSLFPNAVAGTLYEFTGSYQSRDSLEGGKGYWLMCAVARLDTIVGTQISTETIPLRRGWNLFSGPSCPFSVGHITDPANIVVPGTIYGFDNGYVNEDTLSPGLGYWVCAADSGSISLNCTDLGRPAKRRESQIDTALYARLVFRDASGRQAILLYSDQKVDSLVKMSFALPPVPPIGIFDVRFNGSWKIADGDRTRILLQSIDLPVTIHAENLEVLSYQYSLVEGPAGSETNHGLERGRVIVIAGDPSSLIVRRMESALPKEFALLQNFPNPFNPWTTIKYDLPIDTRVSLKLFNILGQEVVTLVNEEQKAGYKSVEWNATNVASGVYFYRIQAGSFIASKKLLLLK